MRPRLTALLSLWGLPGSLLLPPTNERRRVVSPKMWPWSCCCSARRQRSRLLCRPQAYFLFQGLVHLLQSRYQKKRHYALRSMGMVRVCCCSLCALRAPPCVCRVVCLTVRIDFLPLWLLRSPVPLIMCQVSVMDVSNTETLTEMHSGLYTVLVFVFLAQAFQVPRVLQLWRFWACLLA